MRDVRLGLARMQVALIIVVLVVAAGVGAYAFSTQGGGTQSVSLSITETDPVNQVDSLIPQNVTVKQGTPVALAVQNGDDEVRVFTITDLNVNFTIDAGTTQRHTFTPTKTGTFLMHSPQTLASAASKGKPGTPVSGYITITP